MFGGNYFSKNVEFLVNLKLGIFEKLVQIEKKLFFGGFYQHFWPSNFFFALENSRKQMILEGK